MEAFDQTKLPIQANWQAAEGGAAALGMIEFPLYSDARFVGQIKEDCWPYAFLNTVPAQAEPGRVQIPIVARLFWHAELGRPAMYPNPTTTTLYHGGWISDEVAAVASLALGARLRAGDESRRFDGSDELGTPTAPHYRHPPTLILDPRRLVLPNVVFDGDLQVLAPRLRSIPSLQAEDCIALVRAARLYQDALWVAESEPNLGWLMLVSAVETAANRWREKLGTPVENLQDNMPALAARLVKDGGEELLEFAAKRMSHLVGATKKFVGFVLEHLPNPPPKRPEGAAFQVEWSRSNIEQVLKKVYGYRSEALHGGTPFPAPMCQPAFRLTEGGPPIEVGTLGLGASTLNGYWDAKDMPISMNTFHYLARGALLRWWDSLSAPPAGSSSVAEGA